MDAISKVMAVKINGDFTDTCLLYRNSHETHLNSDKTPKASAFSPDNGMSTDWNKYTSSDECIVRVGLTKKPNGDFKNPELFCLFSLQVSEIKEIEGVSSIDFTPILNDPPILGKPSNPSHSDVWFMDEELRLKFVDIAKPIEINLESVKSRIEVINKELTA